MSYSNYRYNWHWPRTDIMAGKKMTFYFNVSHYNVHHNHFILWSKVPFETNLCLSSMYQEICQGGCVTKASVKDAEKECMR